jgi:CheY-like chemotaxis protein
MTKKILLIEDDRSIREVLSLSLEQESYVVKTATDGHQALQLIERGHFRPDLILLDLHMPRLDGEQFLTIKKNHAMLMWVPVVVLTAVPPAYRPRHQLQGIEVLSKPIDFTTLTDSLERYFEAA